MLHAQLFLQPVKKLNLEPTVDVILSNSRLHSSIISTLTEKFKKSSSTSTTYLFIYLLLRQMAAKHTQNSNIHTTQLYKN